MSGLLSLLSLIAALMFLVESLGTGRIAARFAGGLGGSLVKNNAWIIYGATGVLFFASSL
jgi:hypothetical protein